MKTGRGGYYFDADVTAEARGTAAPANERLSAGDHVATARAILVQRVAENSGIEEWIGHRSDDDKQSCRIRIATTNDGARRLQHEKQVYDYLEQNELTKNTILQPRSNLAMPVHQSLTWDVPPQSLADLDETDGFLGKLNDTARLQLAIQIASAVAELNNAGIIHGDLKLANIYLRKGAGDGEEGGEGHDLVEEQLHGAGRRRRWKKGIW